MKARDLDRYYYNGGIYHVYNRGDRRLNIFNDEIDKIYFKQMLSRYLSKEIAKRPNRSSYPNFHNKVKLHAFAIMDNHYHLALEQIDDDELSIPNFMKCLTNAYEIKYRFRHKISGTIFEGTYKSKSLEQITNKVKNDISLFNRYRKYLIHYIHNNKRSYDHVSYSSLYYWKNVDVSWLSRETIDEYGSIKLYLEDLDDYRILIQKQKVAYFTVL